MLVYMPTMTSTDNKGRLKLGSMRANSPIGWYLLSVLVYRCCGRWTNAHCRSWRCSRRSTCCYWYWCSLQIVVSWVRTWRHQCHVAGICNTTGAIPAKAHHHSVKGVQQDVVFVLRGLICILGLNGITRLKQPFATPVEWLSNWDWYHLRTVLTKLSQRLVYQTGSTHLKNSRCTRVQSHIKKCSNYISAQLLSSTAKDQKRNREALCCCSLRCIFLDVKVYLLVDTWTPAVITINCCSYEQMNLRRWKHF